MSTEVRWRRGTDAQHAAFIGAMSEITHDTTNHNLRIHDGSTMGGHATLMEGDLGLPLGVTPLDGNGNVPENHLGYVLDMVESKKGAVNGFASLDESGQVPSSQLGNVVGLDKYDYSSKASVEASPVPNTMTYLRIAGYYSAGDGGGAIYKRSASQPTHSGKIQSQDGSWWEIAERTLNFRMFGAKGDGAVDDSTSIQACLNAASSLSIARVELYGGGEFLYGATLTIPNKIIITGDKKTSLKKAASSNFQIIMGQFSSLYNIVIDGNRSNNPSNNDGTLVKIENGHNASICDCIIKGSNGYLIAINTARRIRILNNDFSDYYMHAVAIYSDYSEWSNHEIRGNRVDCNGLGAFLIGSCEGVIVEGNRITGRLIGGRDQEMTITKVGTKITRIAGVTGTEFTKLSPGQVVVVDGGKEFRIVSIEDWNNLTVSEATPNVTNSRASAGTGDMIGVVGSSFVQVINNSVSRCATYAMGISLGSGANNGNENCFINNEIRYSGKNAINVAVDMGTGGISDTLITGNRIFNAGFAGGVADADRDAIYFSSIATSRINGVLITNNTCITYAGSGQTRALIGRDANVSAGSLVIGLNMATGTTNGIGS